MDDIKKTVTNLNVVKSKKKEFNDKILEFKKKYNDIVKDPKKNTHKKNYLMKF